MVNVASITILQPAAGDVWYVGTTRRVTWTATGVSNFLVVYSQDGGAYSSVSNGTSEYSVSWVVPNPPSTQTTIRVSEYHYGVVTKTSGIFEIRPVTDSDDDGMDDEWELDYFDDYSHDESTNGDGDRWTDYEEFMQGTDPTQSDRDAGPEPSLLSCAPARTRGTAGLAVALALAALVVYAVGRAHRQTAIDGWMRLRR
jgi:hypothetical protein